MKLVLATHESSLRHDAGRAHPERPDRIPAVVRGIVGTRIPIHQLSPEPASLELLASVHSPAYLEDLRDFCADGGGALDVDTFAGVDSWEAALRAAAAGPLVCDSLREGHGELGYVAMRPPGHHALRDRAMGFCLLNNVAVTARYLTGGGSRVAIVDWDVHHGNGTQQVFYQDPAVLYLSIHQAGIYPGTGSLSDAGEGAGLGTNLNIAVPSHTGGAFYRRALAEVLAPIISQFEPDWLLVSSGYDAHAADPLASLRLGAADYGAMANMLAPLVPAGRAVVFLEGGYDLDALEESAAATVQGWLDSTYAVDPDTSGLDPDGYLQRAQEVAALYWQLD